MEQLKLDYGLLINGENVTEISYDFGDFTNADYLAACSRHKGDVQNVQNPVGDLGLHFALGVGVILASNKGKGWSAEDFGRVRGSDNFKISMVGLSFFGAKPEAQDQETCAGQSASTPNASTPDVQS